MPYCPKCDMEFVEGVTVCTDCGGPLVESREAAQAQKAAEKEKLEQEMRLRYEEMQKAAKEMEKQPARQPVGTYVKKEQRYEDMNSSASAFFLVGGVLALIAAVSLLGYLPLPLYGVSRHPLPCPSDPHGRRLHRRGRILEKICGPVKGPGSG